MVSQSLPVVHVNRLLQSINKKQVFVPPAGEGEATVNSLLPEFSGNCVFFHLTLVVTSDKTQHSPVGLRSRLSPALVPPKNTDGPSGSPHDRLSTGDRWDGASIKSHFWRLRVVYFSFSGCRVSVFVLLVFYFAFLENQMPLRNCSQTASRKTSTSSQRIMLSCSSPEQLKVTSELK